MSYNGESANEMYHGDEHLNFIDCGCFEECFLDQSMHCECKEEYKQVYKRLESQYQRWLVEQGQAV